VIIISGWALSRDLSGCGGFCKALLASPTAT